LGAALDAQQSETSSVLIPLNLAGGVDAPVYSGIESFSRALGEKNTGIVNMGMNAPISRKSATELLAKDSNTKVYFDRDKGLVLMDAKGRKYTTQGITPIDRVNNHVQKISGYISKFDKTGINPKNIISYNNSNTLNNNISTRNQVFINELRRKGTRIDDYATGLTYRIAQPDGSFDLVKVIMDNSTNPNGDIYVNSLNDEIANNGESRGSALNEIAIKNLSSTSSLLQGAKKESETRSNRET